GRTPFQADSNVALMAMHANEPPPALKNWRSDLPESIELVVDKCLAKNPDTRYSHGRELLLDLENLLRGQPTSIGLHPPLIARRGDHVLTFEHTWDLRSSPAALWPYVSHTDRVNHAIGLTAVNYTTHNDPVHGVQRTAEAMIAGQRIRWQEHPYEWIEGKRLSVLREFIQGPFDWFVNIVQLHPRADGGTQIVQTLQVAPRGWLGKVLAKFQLGAKSRRSFGAVYQQIDHYLQQQQSSSAADDPWGNRHELTTSQRARLNQRMEVLAQRGAEPAVLEVLRQLLEHGSELEVARIRPLALAQQRQVDPQRMLEACLLGAHEGLLLLLWDILCPSCRIPSDVVDTLAALKDHAHCQACNVQFELDFGRSIELIFRAHPELRHAETKTYCIGGPAWSRHVVAQVRLAAGERFACDLALESGAYVLRGPQLPYTIPFRVGSSSTQSRWEVALARAPSADDATGSLSSGLLSSSSQSVSLQSVGSQSAGMPIMLRPDQQAIWLWNDSPRDLEVRIERVASRHDAVTAAAASSTALFRELFGDQVLSSGQLISVAHITLLLVKLCDTGERYRRLGDAQAFTEIRRQLESINRVVRERGGAVIKMIGEAVVATFTTPLAAMEAAAMLCAATDKSDSLPMGSVVQSGPAVVTTLDDRLDYFGRLVHDALSCLDNAQPEKILTSVSVVALPDVQLWLAERQGVVGSVSELPDMAVPVVFIAVPTVTTKP
ncbi:MAG: hypothetical protein IT423_02385, partial [Pirellulaceae bacterium]|nr:hypothetical protein [Pirellulaceae bacterium]